MTFQEIYNKFKSTLIPIKGVREADAMFFLVVEKIAGLSRTQFIVQSEKKVEDSIKKELQDILNRLEMHEPVQYVLGEAWFCNHSFFVDENVLIPRPETEEIIELLKSKVDNQSVVLDIGTGSGCIAISVALEFGCPVFAMDVSQSALNVAVRNADILGAQVGFFIDDIFEISSLPFEGVDLIVSNPPYVLDKEKAQMEKNVLDFEPELALFVPNADPLKFYKAIALLAEKALFENGWLVLEINEKLGCSMFELLNGRFSNVEIVKDMHGKDRFAIAQKLY